MSLDDVNNISNDYNKSAEKNLAYLADAFNLTKGEKEKIWQLSQEKDQLLQQETTDYKNNWGDRYKAEYDRLRGQQRPEQQYTPMQNNQPDNDVLKRTASQNIQAQYRTNIKSINQTKGQEIDQVLDAARVRQHEQKQNKTQDQNLTQEFNRVR